ncbi:hypothetical protein [Enterococcus avium]|uniref:hypothetical protein n=1 Tax=Enterococcus avium TaxID=33945 RepID=UPI001F56549F|nr:hypothetical protein [Enterococcus avium]
MKKIILICFVFIGIAIPSMKIQAHEGNSQDDTMINYVPQLVTKATPLEPNPDYIYKSADTYTKPRTSIDTNNFKNSPNFLLNTGSKLVNWFYLVGILLIVQSVRLMYKRGDIK